MQVNAQRSELMIAVAYCGPGLAGKSTNLHALHASAQPGTASALVSGNDGVLRFEVAAPELGRIQGYAVRVAYRAVSGQHDDAATRCSILDGVDGVVFVADSRREAIDENIEAMNELLAQLRQLGLPDDLPVVVQYNKQDLPTAVPPTQLEPLLNVRAWSSQRAIAAHGEGVHATARTILDQIALRLAQAHLPAPGENAIARGASGAARIPQPVPLTSAPTAPRSWLIGCWRCSTMLDVPEGRPGTTYTCGACQAIIEIVDRERGLSREPAQISIVPISDTTSSGGYVTQPAEAPSGAVALGPRSAPSSPTSSAASRQSAARGSEVDGFEMVSLLDDTVLGRRLRLRGADQRTVRALVLAPRLIALPGYRQSFDAYVRLAGPIRHPHLLPLHAVYPTRDSLALISADSTEHEPLTHVLARRRVLEPPQALAILRQVALALEEASRHGVIHGWLRPDAILIDAAGNVLLDDLCVAKPLRFLVRELAGASAATEYYLAPEQSGEDAVADVRSDLFVLGALLFRMITGEGLVTGYNAHEALHKVAANGARPLRSTSAQVSRELDTFFKRLTATDRRERYQNYREVIDQLERFLGGTYKRQTMRLTGPAAAAPPAGSTSAARRTTLGNSSGSLGSGSTSASRRTTVGPRRATGEGSSGGKRPSSSSAGVVVAVIVLLAVLGLGVFGYIYFTKRNGPLVQAGTKPPPTTAQTTPPTPNPAPTALVVTPATPVIAPPVTPPVTATLPVTATPSATQAIASPASPVRPTRPTTATAAAANDTQISQSIREAIGAERYQQAFELTTDITDPSMREIRMRAITNAYEGRQREVQRLAETGTDITRIRAELDRVRNAWGVPGIGDWCDALAAAATARLGNTPPPIRPAPTPPPTPTPPAPTPTPTSAPATPAPATPAASATKPAPVVPPHALAQARIAPLLLNGEPSVTTTHLAQLDPAAPETRALQRMIALAGTRAGPLQRALAAKAVLHLSHPITRERCDVTAVDDQYVEITAPSGSSQRLTWSQIPDRAEIGRMFQVVVDIPGVSTEDRSIAAVMLIAADQPSLAVLALRPVRGSLDAALVAELDLAIELCRARGVK